MIGLQRVLSQSLGPHAHTGIQFGDIRLKLGIENECPVVTSIVERARSSNDVTHLAVAELREPRLLADDDVPFEVNLE